MSKKSFRDNPALQFVSRAEKEVSRETVEEKIPETKEAKEIKEIREIVENFKITPITFEAKSKRFNMLIRPSVYINLKKLAQIQGTSVNDLINKIVENYVEINVR